MITVVAIKVLYWVTFLYVNNVALIVFSYEKNYQLRPIRFLEKYIQYPTKALYRTQLRRIINLTGCQIPNHGTEDYYQLVCVLFKPWHSYKDLNQYHTTWEQVFHHNDIFNKYHIYLHHWNILNECYDEKDDIYKQRQLLLNSMKDDYNPSYDINELLPDIMEGNAVNNFLGQKLQEQQIYNLMQSKLSDALDQIGYSRRVIIDAHITNLPKLCLSEEMNSKFWETNFAKNKLNSSKFTISCGKKKNIVKARPLANSASIIQPLTESISFNSLLDAQSVITKILAKMSDQNQPLYNDQIRAITLLVYAHMSPGMKPLLMMLNGIAGSGKSTVLKAFQYALEELEHHDQILVMAFTGTAAANVDGVTFNSVFGSLTRNAQPDKIKLKERIRNVTWLFFDEWSMISTRQLYKISELLCDVCNNQRPFGGMNVVLAGDPAQLPPNYQNGSALYRRFDLKFATHKDGRGDDVKGHFIRKQFTVVVQLRQSMRTEKSWYKAINQARYASCDADSIKTIKSVLMSEPCNIIDITNPMFSFQSIITPRCKFRDNVNIVMSRKFDITFNRKSILFYSLDKLQVGTMTSSFQEMLWKLNDDDTENHPGRLSLSVHKPVTIKYNYDTAHGITNSAEGTVHSWDGYEKNGRNYLNVLYIKLTGKGHDKKYHDLLPIGVVPLTPITRNFVVKIQKKSVIVRRTQIAAILNFAITDYGSQGKSRPWNIFSVTDCTDHFHFYVMASRSTQLKQTAILGKMNWKAITQNPDIDYIKFLMVMEILDYTTEYCYNNPDDTLVSNCYTDDDSLKVIEF